MILELQKNMGSLNSGFDQIKVLVSGRFSLTHFCVEKEEILRVCARVA